MRTQDDPLPFQTAGLLVVFGDHEVLGIEYQNQIGPIAALAVIGAVNNHAISRQGLLFHSSG